MFDNVFFCLFRFVVSKVKLINPRVIIRRFQDA